MSAVAAQRAKNKKEKLKDATSGNVVSAASELQPNKESSRPPRPVKKRKTKGEVQPSRSAVPQEDWTTRNVSNPTIAESNVQVRDKSISQQRHIIPDPLSESDLANGRDETEDPYIRLVARR